MVLALLFVILNILIITRIQEKYADTLLKDLLASEKQNLVVLREYMDYTLLVNELVSCRSEEERQSINDKFTVFSETSIFREEEA